ncbi:magnesium transporter MgtC [Candidatus Peregrinibacteria bacterium CG22_combo_CG10-13_8_21_14_all_49_11]|nr:MAG: magnesium transporter MgtC [Candidatus Peregrinibacteria bacterium CG22_combo_CG10-13_8_21_14_all_49_11]
MDWTFLPFDIIVKILLAAALGLALGVEREWSGKAAGVRTNLIISVGSCLFTILSIDGFPYSDITDPSRIAAQIVTGVGFLGAGALIHTEDHVRGLTTAANIWLVAAVGMACGIGLPLLAIFVTVITVFALIALRPFSSLFTGKRPS